MTLVRNKATGIWEADIRTPGMKRLHVTLKTKVRAKAEPLHAALVALMREGDESLVALVRQRDATPESVARLVRDKKPFSDLRPKLAWPTVREAAQAYEEYLRGHAEREASTADGARWQLAPFVAEFGDLRLDAVPHKKAEEWQAALVTAKSANTSRAACARVEALYAWYDADERRDAAKDGRAPRPLASPLDPKTRPTRTTKRERFLTREEATRLLASTPDYLLAPTATLLLAGLRVEEALHLRVGVDVDLDRDMLVIQARGKKGGPGYWQPKGDNTKKGGARREVPITADLRAILAYHLPRWASPTYAFPTSKRRTYGTAHDIPMPSNTYREHFEKICDRAGLLYGNKDPMGVVPHTLRHTFASWLVQADVNPYRVAKLMGNSLQQIQDTYGHLSPSDNRAAVALLSGAVPLPTPTDEADA